MIDRALRFRRALHLLVLTLSLTAPAVHGVEQDAYLAEIEALAAQQQVEQALAWAAAREEDNVPREKRDRVKEYYATLDREDKKLEEAKPAPKPFKSSLASSLKLAVSNTSGSQALGSRLKEKVIYSVEQLRR